MTDGAAQLMAAAKRDSNRRSKERRKRGATARQP